MTKKITLFLCLLLAASLTGCSGDDTIHLADGHSSSDKEGVNIQGNTITVSSEGTYHFDGSLTEGQIVVSAEDEEVHLLLDGVSIRNSSGPCIFVAKADKVHITTVEGSENSLLTYADFSQTGESNVDGCIFSRSDLILDGAGSLNVICTDKHAIVSKDNLKITDGTYSLTASPDGKAIQGKDSVSIEGGDITVTDASEGIEGHEVYIKGGSLDISSRDDGINATNKDNTDENAKKIGDDSCVIVISGGVVNINAGGDGIDSNGSVTISGGETYVSGSGDDKNAALDHGTGSRVTGGIFVATGFSKREVNFGEDSTQGAILCKFMETIGKAETVSLLDSDGNEIISYTPPKEYNCVLFSSPDIKETGSYTIEAGNVKDTVRMNGLIYGEGYIPAN